MYSNYRSEPDYTAALALLQNLSNDGLKELLNDDEKFAELLKDVKEFKHLETEKEMLLASNRSLAEFNLGKEPRLVEGRERLAELSARGEALCRSVEEKMSEIKNHSGNLSLDTALALLQTSAAESEEESDEIAEKFLEGETDLDTFLDQFALRRKQMHLRRVKADKMAELMRRQPTPSPVANYFSQIQQPSGMPYPAVSNMPMPGRFGPNY